MEATVSQIFPINFTENEKILKDDINGSPVIRKQLMSEPNDSTKNQQLNCQDYQKNRQKRELATPEAKLDKAREDQMRILEKLSQLLNTDKQIEEHLTLLDNITKQTNIKLTEVDFEALEIRKQMKTASLTLKQFEEKHIQIEEKITTADVTIKRLEEKLIKIINEFLVAEETVKQIQENLSKTERESPQSWDQLSTKITNMEKESARSREQLSLKIEKTKYDLTKTQNQLGSVEDDLRRMDNKISDTRKEIRAGRNEYLSKYNADDVFIFEDTYIYPYN